MDGASDPPATTCRRVLVYDDEGVGPFMLGRLLTALRDVDGAVVRRVGADEIVDGRVLRDRSPATVFVMPGGADLPYARRLDGPGNANLRAYVEAGGGYLGLCAGAYYACRRLRFRYADGAVVAGARELDLFPGTAVGPIAGGRLRPFDDTPASATVTTVTTPAGDRSWTVCYHGGPRFVGVPDNWATLHWSGAGFPPGQPAVVMGRVGRGQVVLSSVHPEIRSAADWTAYTAGHHPSPVADAVLAGFSRPTSGAGLLSELVEAALG